MQQEQDQRESGSIVEMLLRPGLCKKATEFVLLRQEKNLETNYAIRPPSFRKNLRSNSERRWLLSSFV